MKAANIKNGVTIFGVKGTFTGWIDSTMPMSVVPGWTVSRSLDTGWKYYALNYSTGYEVYSAYCTNSGRSRITWLIGQGFRPRCQIQWIQTARSGKSGNVSIEFRCCAIWWDSSASSYKVLEVGSQTSAFGGKYWTDFYSNESIDKTRTTTYSYNDTDPYTCQDYPYSGDTFWVSGFSVTVSTPTNAGQGRVTSVNLYWQRV